MAALAGSFHPKISYPFAEKLLASWPPEYGKEGGKKIKRSQCKEETRLLVPVPSKRKKPDATRERRV